MSKILKVAAYYRVSSIVQNLDSQRDSVRDYCRRRDWEPREFSDKISGAKWTRIGLESLMAEVRTGKVDVIVCYRLDRLGRSLPHLAQLIEELTSNKVALISVSDGIDTSNDSPTAQLQLNVLMAIAQFERQLIRERVIAGLTAAKSRGQKLGPKFQWTGEKAAKVIELAKSGKGVRQISRELTMSAATVSRVIKRHANQGRGETLARLASPETNIPAQDSGPIGERLS